VEDRPVSGRTSRHAYGATDAPGLERSLRYAVREEEFLPILGACVTLLTIGTMSYALREDWNVVDGLYFAVTTLTTSSIAAPDLVLGHD
jgi:hypothetical protein